SKFSQNSEKNPAKRYYQTTIGAISSDGIRRYFDRYNNDFTKWIENSDFRSLDDMFAEDVVMASRINLAFSCIDEFFIVRRTESGVVGDFYNNLMGHIMTDKTTFADNEDGDFIYAVPVNLFSEYLGSLDGTGDDMIVVRRNSNSETLHFSVYRCTSSGSVERQQFRYVRLSAGEEADILTGFVGSSDLSASALVGVVPVRHRNSIYLDGTRPVDAGVISLYQTNNGLKVSGMLNGNEVDQTLQFDGKLVVSACTADIDGDFFDEVCLLAETGNNGESESSILFIKYDKNNNNFYLVSDEIELETEDYKYIYSFRTGTYTKVGTFPE
ncbi:MAG: hypothetical protein PHV88_08375, partial [Eubacteriales bacterium]|nr:hypothetical protein [Eubacteriales bacterium]